MSRIYTRGGDRGETGLRGGSRVDKDDPRIQSAGDIDELNATLGLVRTTLGPDMKPLLDILERLQHELFILGAELASPLNEATEVPEHRIEARHVARLERDIDTLYEPFRSLNTFVLPAGGLPGSTLHLARTVARRAERSVTLLSRRYSLRAEIPTYVNRISDLLFAMALTANRMQGIEETHPDYTR